MADVILFPPNGPSEEFRNVTNVNINNTNGVLTFYQPRAGDNKDLKFRTTVPFTVREEIAG
jgi:hypothetical protein